jgi:hypothetical protein
MRFRKKIFTIFCARRITPSKPVIFRAFYLFETPIGHRTLLASDAVSARERKPVAASHRVRRMPGTSVPNGRGTRLR